MPSLPPPPERDVPLRDRMLKQPDTEDRYSPKYGDIVSILGDVYMQCMYVSVFYSVLICIIALLISSRESLNI